MTNAGRPSQPTPVPILDPAVPWRAVGIHQRKRPAAAKASEKKPKVTAGYDLGPASGPVRLVLYYGAAMLVTALLLRLAIELFR